MASEVLPGPHLAIEGEGTAGMRVEAHLSGTRGKLRGFEYWKCPVCFLSWYVA